MATQAAAPAQQNGKKPETALERLNRPARDHSELRSLLTSSDVIKQIGTTLPEHMKPERLAKIMLSACLQTPKLMRVNQLSLLQTLTKLSELGLEPGSAFGHVALVPFENTKSGRTDVNIIIMYKGLLELARRSGFVLQIESHVVFEDEVFDLEWGLRDTRKFRHVPNLRSKRDESKAFAVYCIAHLKNGGEHMEVMSMDEVRRIRDGSKNYKPGKGGPWEEHFLQMARKTVIRRACNYLPLSPEMAEALELDSEHHEVSTPASRSIIDAAVSKPSAAAEDITSAMAARADDEPQEDATPVPAHDPETGEVVEEAASSAPPADAPEPEAGTVDHLLWRIARADAAALPGLIQETGKLSKDEPRRLEVSAAISARRKAVTP